MKTKAQSADDVLASWQTSSKYWNKHQDRIEEMFAPLTSALIDAAGIHSGQFVLDIGGGTGEPSLSIAPVVENGRVAYTDPAAGMVETARDAARRRSLTNIEFHQAPAQELPFADNTFDVAVGRLSAMFFPDVRVAMREVLRVIKPGATMAFLVWSRRDANPFFSRISDELNRFVPDEPEDEDAPGAFRFARSGKLEQVLQRAGAESVEERVVDFDIAAPVDLDGFWELRTEMSDTFRTKLAQLNADQISELKVAAKESVKEFFSNGAMSFPAQVLIVTGKKPKSRR